jgi:hypothetical protein
VQVRLQPGARFVAKLEMFCGKAKVHGEASSPLTAGVQMIFAGGGDDLCRHM